MYLLLVYPPHGLDHALSQGLSPWQEAQRQDGCKLTRDCCHQTVATVVATIVNPSYQALQFTLAKFQAEKEC